MNYCFLYFAIQCANCSHGFWRFNESQPTRRYAVVKWLKGFEGGGLFPGSTTSCQLAIRRFFHLSVIGGTHLPRASAIVCSIILPKKWGCIRLVNHKSCAIILKYGGLSCGKYFEEHSSAGN